MSGQLRSAFKNVRQTSAENGLSRSASIAEFFSTVESISTMEITQAIATLQQQLRELRDVMERVVSKPRVRQIELDLVWRMLSFIQPHVTNLKDSSGELRLHCDRLKGEFAQLRDAAEAASDRVRKRSEGTLVVPQVLSAEQQARAHFRALEEKERRKNRKRFEGDRRRSAEKKVYARAVAAAQRLNGSSGVLRHTAGELGSHRKNFRSPVPSAEASLDESTSEEVLRKPPRREKTWHPSSGPVSRPSASRLDPSLGGSGKDLGAAQRDSAPSAAAMDSLSTMRGDPTLGFSGYTPKRTVVKSDYDPLRSTPEMFRRTPESSPTVSTLRKSKSSRKKKSLTMKIKSSSKVAGAEAVVKSPRSPRFSSKWGSTGRTRGSTVTKGFPSGDGDLEQLQLELRKLYRVRRDVYIRLNPKADCDYLVYSSGDDKIVGSVNLISEKFCFLSKKGRKLKEISDPQLFQHLKKESPKRSSLMSDTFTKPEQSSSLFAPPPVDQENVAEEEIQRARQIERNMEADGVELNADGNDFHFEDIESDSDDSHEVEFYVAHPHDSEKLNKFEDGGMDDVSSDEEEVTIVKPLPRVSRGPPRKMLPKTPSELQFNQKALESARSIAKFPQKPPPRMPPDRPPPRRPRKPVPLPRESLSDEDEQY